MGLRGNRRCARFKVVFNEVNQLNGPPLRGRAMGSHRLTDGEVLVARLTGAHKAYPERCGVSASALNLQLDLGPWLGPAGKNVLLLGFKLNFSNDVQLPQLVELDQFSVNVDLLLAFQCCMWCRTLL
jgi:hypothetical protein